MLFTELRFVAFFVLAFAVHWALRSNRSRKAWLLLCSYVFYAAWDWRFCGLMLASTIIDFGTGHMLASEAQRERRKLWLTVSLCANLGMLGFFKYFNFFVESGQGLFDWLGFPFPLRTLNIILPVGISFYTFQTLSYSIDVYRGSLKPVKNFFDFALFVGFFPQLVAGPIVRAVDFLPQLETKRRLAAVDFRGCLTLFLIGFVKKACVSDNLAPIIDEYFANPAGYDVASAWIAVSYYSVQIYCDFSGYSDMAIATAGLLGYRLTLNFDFPFFRSNLSEFWRTWHISLSSWVRDYLFLPLCRKRRTQLFIYRNIAITLVLIGLWHGASWNFVIFGVMHAVGTIIVAEWARLVPRKSTLARLVHLAGPLITFWYVAASMIVFRPSGVTATLEALRAYLFFDSSGTAHLGGNFVWLFPLLVAVHWIAFRKWLQEPWLRAPNWLWSTLWGAGFALALQWAASDYRAFVYFQF